jgi:O-antigen/teichoic acid export membrane protein
VTGWARLLRSDAFRSIGWLGAARAFGMLCGLATTVIWARLMPPEVFGEFKVVIAAITFVSAFCLLGTAQAAIMAAAKNQDGSLALLLRHKLFANAAGSIALAGAAVYYGFAPAGSQAIALGLLAAALAFPLYNTTDIWMSWANGKSRFDEVASGQAALSLLALAAIGAVALFGIEQVWIVMLVYLGALAGVNVAMMTRAAAQRTNADIDRLLIAYGRHATVAMMFGSLLALDVVILNHFHSPADVAVYVIALQFPEQLKGILALLGQVVAPRLYAVGNLAQSWQSLRRLFWILYSTTLVIGLVGFLALPPIMDLLFGAHYAAAADHAKWLWLALACTNPITTYLGTALLATRQKMFLYVPNIGFPLLLLALYMTLVSYGVEGMVLSRIIASVTLAAFYVSTFVFLRPRVPQAMSGSI